MRQEASRRDLRVLKEVHAGTFKEQPEKAAASRLIYSRGLAQPVPTADVGASLRPLS
jgi:hypothetical protein